MDFRKAIIDEFRDELATTKRVLERVPGDKLRSPHPKSMTLGQLAMHMTTFPGNLARIIKSESFDLSARTRNPLTPPENTAELFTALEQSAHDAEAVFTETSPEQMEELWRLVNGDREIFARPRFTAWRSLILNHWYHHRGQLTVYLRLLDIPVPAVYGSSADERIF